MKRTSSRYSRSVCWVYSGVSLLCGGLIYLFFGKETHLRTAAVQLFPWLESCRITFPGAKLIANYLPDFFWASSLTFALYAILPRDRGLWRVLPGAFAVGAGFLWELLQWAGICSGTGDVADVWMYLVAACAAMGINFKKMRYEK